MPTQAQQTAVTNYLTEANAPTVIGTGEAGTHIVDTTTVAGRVLEQCGKSRKLLNLLLLADSSPSVAQAASDLTQALGATARDCSDLQDLLMRLAQHSAKIDAGNVALKAQLQANGYTAP